MMLGLYAFAVQNARAEFQATTLHRSPAPVDIDDPEFGTTQTVLGYLVYEHGRSIGETWSDAEGVCWRTLDGQRFGRAGDAETAVRELWEAAR